MNDNAQPQPPRPAGSSIRSLASMLTTPPSLNPAAPAPSASPTPQEQPPAAPLQMATPQSVQVKTSRPIETPPQEPVNIPHASLRDTNRHILHSTRKEDYLLLVGTFDHLPWGKIVNYIRDMRATDLIFNNGFIYVRSAGQLQPLPEDLQVPPEQYEKGLFSILPHQRALDQLFSKDGATDFAITLEGQRFRGNVFFEMAGINGVFRPISSECINPEKLMLEPKARELVLSSKQGLVLVAGPTGSGKSATVVSMLEDINHHFNYNVITIEDPIEFIFTPRKCTFSQREVGQHVESFDSALRSAMRQNPDVIFVGEIRDYPTMAAALKASETGHLVFATVHTRRVYTTLNRLVNMAPASERDQIRDAIAQNLLMILCQRLLHGVKGGLVPCREIVMRNNALIGVITSGKMRDLNNVMLSNRQNGMIDWNNALNNMVAKQLITSKEADLYRDREDNM